MKDVIVYVGVGFILLFAAAAMDADANQQMRDRCEERGGTFYEALNAGASLCQVGK